MGHKEDSNNTNLNPIEETSLGLSSSIASPTLRYTLSAQFIIQMT